ncbi:MAG TPA: isochorismatase, partial [bacterium]
SKRLMGRDPQTGPVAQILRWAESQPADALDIIHIRDWHDDKDPRQKDHLDMFGKHCIGGTPGSALVLGFGREEEDMPNVHFVNSIALNDFEGTNLAEVFWKIVEKTGHKDFRVGVIGVWTEAKVSFLLYDLKTRCRLDDLATCSALTASNSRAQHFNALEQLRKILGVRIFDSTGEFADYLNPDSEFEVAPVAEKGFETSIKINKPDFELDQVDCEILSFLYSDSTQVTLDPLTGGYSGALVFRAESKDAVGHEHAPSVAKIGPPSEIGTERAAFERVEQILGNSAPRIMKYVDFKDRAGIKYSYAAMGKGKIRTFKDIYDNAPSQEYIDNVLDEVFNDIFEPFYAAATYERLPMLEYYTFAPGYADRARMKVEKIFGDKAHDQILKLPDGTDGMNVADFYTNYVAENLNKTGEFHYVSYVHGDLNTSNILIDGRDNIWIIDFFQTGRGHVLKDLLKMENDIQYILTPIDNEEDLKEGMLISRALSQVEDLRKPLPEMIDGLVQEKFQRAWRSIRKIRDIGAVFVREDRNPKQSLIGMLRYSMHTQSFLEADFLQKKWAMVASCIYAEKITRSGDMNRLLRVDWLNPDCLARPGRLGMTLCPGRVDHGRKLNEDLHILKNSDVTYLYGLLTERELEWAGVTNIKEECEKQGITYKLLPIPDQGAPSMMEAVKISREILDILSLGKNVVLHCVGGLGRTGMIAACISIASGLEVDEAITMVRDVRSPRSIESREQENFVRSFAEQYQREPIGKT